jgi:hypothetical protein
MSISEAKTFLTKHSNTIFFVGGFLIDAITLTRIDSWLDLLLQTFYLLAIAAIVVQQEKFDRGHWVPGPRMAKIWHYSVEALHFCYGSLLSAYVVFYFKSSTFTKSSVFLIVVIALMFINEMPQIRKFGSRLRLGLYALCVASYLNYLFPVIIGRMGAWVFAMGIFFSGWICWLLVKKLSSYEPQPMKSRWSLSLSPVGVLALIVFLYAFRLIPPVPLSLQFAGIYHQVERQNGGYELSRLRWPWYQFWRTQDRPFLARPGDQIFCFVRVFAPRRFQDQVYLRWSVRPLGRKAFLTSDRIALNIYGGRGEGFRGFAAKSNYEPGHWKVAVETADGRELGEVTFDLQQDNGVEERVWVKRRM